jgi:hypothetical protein
MITSMNGTRSVPLFLILLFTIILLAAQGSPAQQRMRMERPNKVDRVERLKQMKLMEDLQLGEEESVRFMSKRKAHEEQMRGLEEERGKILDDLAISLEDKAGDDKLRASCDRVLEVDRKMFEERKRYQDEMRKFLSVPKYAKLLLFERDFQSQVRDAMKRSMGRSKSKYER